MAPRAPVRARVGPRIGRPLRAHARADPYRTYLRLGQSQWSRFDDRPAGLSGTLRPTTRADTWIFDGDLGPHDVLEPRLGVADTVIILDFSLLRCTWRSIQRSSEGIDFWRWVIGYRRRSLPVLIATIATHAPQARVHRLRTPRMLEALLADMSAGYAAAREHPDSGNSQLAEPVRVKCPPAFR